MAMHNKVHKRMPSLIAAACISSVCLSSAFADDTEVFFGQVDPNLNTNPNVLFVLDTSGSMRYRDGTDTSRLERMKNALDVILDNATNVNIGVMQFSGEKGGGAVVYPITPIDQEVCEQNDCGKQSAGRNILSGDDDVEQSFVDGKLVTDGNALDIGTSVSGTDPRLVGLRFTKINIPQGATVTSAVMQFHADKDSTDSPKMQIGALLTDDAPAFPTADFAMINHPITSTLFWTPDEWKQDGIYTTNDISSILQELVDQPGWCGGQNMALMIAGVGGVRKAKSFNQTQSGAPVLKYTYDTTSVPVSGGCINKTHVSSVASTSDDAEEKVNSGNVNISSSDLELPYVNGEKNQLVGMRFTDIKIPKDAIITDARIQFEVDEGRSGYLDLKITAEAADNPVTFEADYDNLSARPKLAPITWTDVPALPRNGDLVTDDLTSLVQQLVNRDGWKSGNAMAFYVSSVSGKNYRELESYDGEKANSPKLRINFKSNSSIEQPTVITAREKVKDVVAGMQWEGGTPIVDAYYEAARYMRGEPVGYGKRRGAYSGGSRKLRVSVPDSYTGGDVYRHKYCTDADLDSYYCKDEVIHGSPTYISPLKSSCQTNHIVMLSDGQATSNTSADKIRALVDNAACKARTDQDEMCGIELAKWLDETDHNEPLNGKQQISTFTIGFNFSSPFLEDLAKAGGGTYSTASSSADLVNVFSTILGDVLAVDTSFVAPGATVNQFNRLTHRSDIYFALFKPDQRPTWTGNLKRYEVGEDTVTEKITIKDVNGEPAVDTASGFFKDTSRSWWRGPSEKSDGNQVGLGGAAGELDFGTGGTRNIYTYVDDYSQLSSGIELNKPEQKLSEANPAITAEHLGIADGGRTLSEITGYRRALLRWARGLDEKDEDDDNDKNDWRLHMGDPMHARPVILNYYKTATEADTSVFVGTNEGYLHSFEREFGKELYSFVPKELLPNFDIFWNNQSGDPHPYGLDGSLSTWTTDYNENVTIDPGEKAFLYTGMRRGGNNYYALNVSERENPKLAWVIEGGKAGFEELGQTWSKMSPTKIRFNGEERDVLVFGAGYDENQDWVLDTAKQTIPRSPDTVGRGIYIVDAETGKRLWSVLGSNTGDQFDDELDYSMPGDLRILDADFDGFADQIYASDTGGRIWRFDFTPYHESGDLLSGGILADLSGAELAGERRFYYEPDVAIISDDGDRFLAISIGSGWRAHPLDQDTQDRFYMIKSPHLFEAPAEYGKSTDGGLTYTPITENDLVDVTTTTPTTPIQYGWKFDLDSVGEKVLGTSVTANNQVIFTSYRPKLSVGACTTAIGGGSVYALNILNGSPTVDMNGDGVIDEKDREMELAHGGIPPEPAVLITEKGPTLLVGPEQPFDPKWVNLTRRTFWVDKGDAQD